jgi:hypothetical protein
MSRPRLHDRYQISDARSQISDSSWTKATTWTVFPWTPRLRPLNPPRIDRFSLWPRIYDARIPYRGLLPCICLWIIERPRKSSHGLSYTPAMTLGLSSWKYDDYINNSSALDYCRMFPTWNSFFSERPERSPLEHSQGSQSLASC